MKFKQNKIFPNAESLTEWVSTQYTGVIDMIDTDTSIDEKSLAFYNFMIKATVKPQLDMNVYNSLQTTAYHSKDINAIFCPIFKEIKPRILSILDPRFALLCVMSPDEFAEYLSNKYHPEQFIGKPSLEIDMSKFDKSHGGIALAFECSMMSLFGVDYHLVKLWYDA